MTVKMLRLLQAPRNVTAPSKPLASSAGVTHAVTRAIIGKGWRRSPVTHACFRETNTKIPFIIAETRFYSGRHPAIFSRMASPPLQPVPMRAPEKPANVNLRHPVPDLQSVQGAYVGNIERLEEHAERMSEAGSDLQEEIRKTYSELKLVDSRRSSLHSIQTSDEALRHARTLSRGNSTVSHANSIVDLNGNARWGGYSPGGYITSPVGSLRSGTWSNPPTSMQRQRSESKASRLGQIVHPEEVEEEEELSHETLPESPKSSQSASSEYDERDSEEPSQRKVSSFTRIFDEVANGLPENLRNSVHLGTPPKFALQPEPEPEDNQYDYVDPSDIPDRPSTAASTNTTHQARTLWMDFDGVHCPDTVEEEPEPSQGSKTHSRQSSNTSFMMRSNLEVPSTMAPPPEDGMVFYPAPVPRMLNLPKRLSQLPASNVAARRRTQLLESMQTENRKSMPLLGASTTDLTMANKRKSRQSLINLPPQLRASAYFDNQAAPTQEFAVKGESAEDTLESILDASARAPVSAFTDHPMTGSVGKDVYGPQHKRKTSKLAEVPPTLQETRRRSSFNLLDTKHKSNGEATKKLKKRNSSADMNLLLVKASESRMSLGDQLEERDEDARGPQAAQGETPTRPSFDAGDDDCNPDDIHEEEALSEHESEEEEQQYGAPTTLLAELQLRKAKQKSRNMNYVTLMEQGLINGRQTLLQLNDVAEAEKQRRIRKKVNLAWEAPEEDSDDDVPLGVLYRQAPLQERRQTMGLIEQRELEDIEPLSSRRNRLQGGNPNARRTQHLGASSSQLNLVPAIRTPEPESEEEEGETLGERMRRLKEKSQRDPGAGIDVRKSTVSGDFAAEMMGAFGSSEPPKDVPRPTPSPEEEEETLGQRRARLLASASAEQPSRPPLGSRASTSLADLLAANPLDAHNQARKVSNEMLVSNLPQGSLLQKNEVEEGKRRQQRLTATMRASSYGVGSRPQDDDDDVPLGVKMQGYRQVQGQKAGMVGGGMGMQQPQMMGGMGMQHPGMMPQSSMGMPMQMGMQNPQMMGQMGQMGQMGMMNGMPMMPGQMMGMNGMPMQMPMGMGMGMGMGMMGPPMDPRQRDQIDRWMSGIRH
jgi:hypothetical protein